MTSQLQIFESTKEALTSSQEASHVSRIVQQASDLARKTSAISGRICLERFEKFPRAGLWAKMFAALLIGTEGWYSTRCKLTWSLRATKCSRFYFQLQPSTLRTEETGSGLLPTVTCMDSSNATATMKSTQVKEGSMHSVTLNRAMTMGMLPTPCAQDCRLDKLKPANPMQTTLSQTAAHHHIFGQTGQLNPRFVAEMMGFPPNWTELPFQSGEPNQSRDMETP